MNLTNLLTLVCLGTVLAIVITYRSGAADGMIDDAIARVTGDDSKKEAAKIGITPEQLQVLQPIFGNEGDVDDAQRRLAMARYYGNLEAARQLNEARKDDLRWARTLARRHAHRAPAPSYRAVGRKSYGDPFKFKSIFERSRSYQTNGSAWTGKSGRVIRRGGTLRGGGGRR